MRNIQLTPTIANKDHPSVEKYFNEIGREKLITGQEEASLAAKIRQGDRTARERLIRSNLRFVVSVAKKYQYQGLPLSDLISEGNLGLIKAAERFDETRGFKFISFAVWWIRQSISSAIIEHARVIRLPMNKIHDITRINKAIAEIEQETLRHPTLEQLAEHLQRSKEHVRDAMDCAPWTASYDAPLNEEGFSLLDSTPQDAISPDHDLIVESQHTEMNQLLSALTNRERQIIEMTYGMDGGHAMNPTEIAKYIDMSPERIRQLRNAALIKLQNRVKTSLVENE
jgi:RNA polymerase primary sigma factor